MPRHISGCTADVIAQRGVLDEGMHFLQKPFSMDDAERKRSLRLTRCGTSLQGAGPSRRHFGPPRLTGAKSGEDHFRLLYTSFRSPTEITGGR